jgi:GNAT superfamily N-acetyltransferase
MWHPKPSIRGIGKSLLAAAEAMARQRGVEELHLESTRTAEAFYRRNGVQPSGPVQVWADLRALPTGKSLISLHPLGQPEH